MARARLLHPEFARHEKLGELSHSVRLLFALLPTIADREGLIEDRPRRIKADLFPYDKDTAIDVDSALAELHDAGFVVRYQVGDSSVISIPGFKRWQKPHPREKKSELPMPGVITNGEGAPKVSPRSPQGRKSLPVSDPVSDPVSVEEPTAAGASATPPAEPRPDKPEKPKPSPEQEACRRVIRARFEAEWKSRAVQGEEFRWNSAEHIGITGLAALDSEGKGTNPAKGLRALETFIERMAVKKYYAENFAPRIVAQEINNLRQPVQPDRAQPRGAAALQITEAAKAEHEIPGRKML